MTVKHLCVIAVLGLVALPYACIPIYRFPEPAPFAGPHLYNPYAGLTGRWQRANLHAHGTAWGGLTSGEQPSQDVVRTYRALGYDVAGVSNYHQIAAHAGVDTMPLYEHGYNIHKRHQLAIGARHVDWFDVPLWQALSQRQHIIQRVGRSAELVALVHPQTRDAYTPGDLRRLTGYQLIEIVNGPFRSEAPWDVALSGGRLVWALANDDTHDTTDPRRTAAAWTMINAPSSNTHDVVAGLKAGRSYAASRNGDRPAPIDATLRSVELVDGTLVVTTSGSPATFTFVGQNGTVRRTVEQTNSAHYQLGRHDSYVRTIVQAPYTTLYLNPVVRYDGRALHSAAATVDPGPTWMARALWVTAWLVPMWRVWRRRAAGHATSTALQPLSQADRETA